MKKNILMTLALLMTSAVSFAQTEVGNPKFYTVPAVFYPTDEVTFYFDMADVGFREGEDLYWWVWQPTEPDAGNWENSSDFAKLDYLGDGMYKKTFVPVDYFFQNSGYASKEDLLAFMESDWGEAGYWSRLKTKDGSVQSGVFCVEHNRTTISDFAATGAAYGIFSGDKTTGYTDKWTMSKPLSILFNGDVQKIGGKTLNELAAQGDFMYFGTHAGLQGFYTNENDEVIEYDFVDDGPNLNQGCNVWRPSCVEKIQLKPVGGGIWRWNVLTPQEYFAYNPVNADEGGIAADDGTYYYLTDMGITQNGNWAVNPDFVASFEAQTLKFGLIYNEWWGSEWGFEFKAGTAEAYPDPSFTFFPSKVSTQDIITFIRQYNGRLDGELTWTIKAGSKTFSGTMGGTRDRRQGSANLLDQLAGVSAESMQVTITNAKGAVVAETEIPLTTVDK